MGLLKIFLFGLLTSIVNVSSHTKCVSLINQKCNIQPTLINLYPNKRTQGLCYYPFAVYLDRCVRSCDGFNDLSNKVCVPNKTDDLNLSIFNMISQRIYHAKVNKNLMVQNVIQIKSGITINVSASVYIKKHSVRKKGYIWNPAT